MSFNGAQINKTNGGLGGGEATDRTAVMVLGCDAIAGTLETFKKYELLQLSDAETLGITETHDTTAKRLDYYHLSEIFRLSPETCVHLIAVPTTTKASDLKTLPDFITALRSIENLNTIACGGLTADDSAATAIMGLQILVDDLAKDHIYIDAVLLEGIGTYLSANYTDLADLRVLESPNVSLIIGQDAGIADKDTAYKNHAAIGSALGMLLVRAVHENLGSVDIEAKPRARKGEQDYTLSNVKQNRFLSASLSNGISFKKLSGPDQKKLNELGYIYVGMFEGYGGYFFSNSHTCDKSESDYCFIERNAIWNKAARIIRKTLIPRVRGKVQADPATGYIKSTTLSDWENRARKALSVMLGVGNCAEFDIYINPKQAAVSTKPFQLRVKIVADGIAHEFEIDLGFTNKITS